MSLNFKKFPAFYGTRKFITAFTSACHLSLSWARFIPPHSISWRLILILSSHLSLGLPSGLFPSGFPTKTLVIPLLSPIRAICPAHLILLDFITRKILGEEYRSLSSLLCSFLHSPVTSSLLDPNILNTLSSTQPQPTFLPQWEWLLNYREVKYRNGANNKHVVVAVAVAAAAVVAAVSIH